MQRRLGMCIHYKSGMCGYSGDIVPSGARVCLSMGWGMGGGSVIESVERGLRIAL